MAVWRERTGVWWKGVQGRNGEDEEGNEGSEGWDGDGDGGIGFDAVEEGLKAMYCIK